MVPANAERTWFFVSLPSIPTVCRTVVVLAFLLALALAGRPGWASFVPALALVAVWIAPLVVRHRRRAVVAVADAAPAEAPAA
ncbi:hypothetical protein [Geodermatophilus sp. URMC 64]